MIKVNKNNEDFELHYLEHMLHHKNLENVFQYGILSHNEVYRRGIIKEDISMSEVQKIRQEKELKINNDLTLGIHDFVPLYFNSKNPMLYKRRELQPELVILLVSADIIHYSTLTDDKFTIFSDGNAGSKDTRFFSGVNKLFNVDFELLFSGSWNDEDPDIKRENVRKMCSEVLVYPSISVQEIIKIICPNDDMYEYVTNLQSSLGSKIAHINVEVQDSYFF